jgi:hypothetical protein
MNKYAFIPVTLLITSIIGFTSLKEKPSYISVARTVQESRFTKDKGKEVQPTSDFVEINTPEIIPIAEVIPEIDTPEKQAKPEKSETPDKTEKIKKKPVKTTTVTEVTSIPFSEGPDTAALQISKPDTSQIKTPETSQEPAKEKKKRKRFLIFKNKDH